jgi:hypothetical protein
MERTVRSQYDPEVMLVLADDHMIFTLAGAASGPASSGAFYAPRLRFGSFVGVKHASAGLSSSKYFKQALW